jgi:hypothetical protein
MIRRFAYCLRLFTTNGGGTSDFEFNEKYYAVYRV